MPRWLSLLILTLLLQLPGAAVVPLMDRDEPRFAGATVEMVERGTWLVPWFNDAYRFDKPPLTYWWMRLHYLAGGVNELTARLHSIGATWLTALVILSIGARLFSARAGMIAAVVWLTTLQVLIHGRLCVADMPMILCVAIAARALVELLGLPEDAGGEPGPKPAGRWFWILYLALGFGFLAKGPIAVLVPALSLLLYRWWSRRPLPWRGLRPLSGALVALAPVAAWGIPALIETGGLFWKVGIGEHVVKRGAEVLNGRAFIPGYYFLTVFLSLLPWSGYAPQAWVRLRGSARSPGTAFLLAWFAAPLLIFSFYATQLPHYILPGFPAAALVLGRWLADVRDGVAPPPRLTLLTWILNAGLLLSPALVMGALAFQNPGGPVAPLLGAAALLLVTLAAAGLALPALARCKRSAAVLACAALVFALPVHLLCAALRDNSATLRVLAAAGVTPGTQCLGWDFTEPSLVLYSGRPWTFTGKAENVGRFLQRNPDALVTALRREWTLDRWAKSLFAGEAIPPRDQSPVIDSLANDHPGLRVVTAAGLNAARMSWVEVSVLRAVPE
jgi:4-amino-4-deoxy-L-arabinose transferase-like glycosyltransferase